MDQKTLKDWGMGDLPNLSSNVSKLIDQAQQARLFLDSRFRAIRALEGGSLKGLHILYLLV